MPVSTQIDATLVLTLDDGGDGGPVAIECQVINASYTPAAPGESTPTPTACGDTVSEPGDPSNGSITGEVFKDTSATGVTRLLAAAAVAGTEMDYVYTEADEAGYEMSWSGKCTVPQFGIDFAPSKTGRHELSLTVSTSILAAAAAAAPPAA